MRMGSTRPAEGLASRRTGLTQARTLSTLGQRSKHTPMFPKPSPSSTTHGMTRRPLARWLAAATLAITAYPTPLFAQAGAGVAGGLSCALAAKNALGEDEKTQIRRFVETQAADLIKDDAAAISTARDRLAAPLACPNVSVEFRLEFGQALSQRLTPLVTGPSERLSVIATRLIGRAATSASLPALNAALADARQAVRFGAAGGYRELVLLQAQGGALFPERTIDQILDTLAAALAKEADPLVAEALILALDEGRISAPLRTKAMTRMVNALSRRVPAIRAEKDASLRWAPSLLRGVDAARLTLFEMIPAGNVDRDFAVKSALLSGLVFAMARDVLAGLPEAPDPSRYEVVGQLAGATEGLAVIACNALKQQAVDRGLRAIFDKAVQNRDPRPFTDAIQPWIGPNGLLLKPPFGARAEDFAPKG